MRESKSTIKMEKGYYKRRSIRQIVPNQVAIHNKNEQGLLPCLKIYNFFALFARYLDSWCKGSTYPNTVHLFDGMFLENLFCSKIILHYVARTL